jgi:hypothetical protein
MATPALHSSLPSMSRVVTRSGLSYLLPDTSKTHGAHLLDNRQNPRLRIIIPVRPNAQVYFFRICIRFICCHKAEEWIFRRLGDDVAGKRRSRHGAVFRTSCTWLMREVR